MKVKDRMKQINLKNNSEQSTQVIHSSIELSNLNMQVYNELHDQHQSEINVLELIQQQFEQIQDLNKKRSFLLKEVSQYILK